MTTCTIGNKNTPSAAKFMSHQTQQILSPQPGPYVKIHVDGVSNSTKPVAIETPDAKASRSIWDITFPTPLKVGAVYYEDEFYFSSLQLFIPEEAFEYELDSRKLVKPLTTLALTRVRMTSSLAWFKVLGYINIPEGLSSWAPRLNIRCLPQQGKSFVGMRRCQLRLYSENPVAGDPLAVPGVLDEASILCSSSSESDSYEVVAVTPVGTSDDL